MWSCFRPRCCFGDDLDRSPFSVKLVMLLLFVHAWHIADVAAALTPTRTPTETITETADYTLTGSPSNDGFTSSDSFTDSPSSTPSDSLTPTGIGRTGTKSTSPSSSHSLTRSLSAAEASGSITGRASQTETGSETPSQTPSGTSLVTSTVTASSLPTATPSTTSTGMLTASASSTASKTRGTYESSGTYSFTVNGTKTVSMSVNTFSDRFTLTSTVSTTHILTKQVSVSSSRPSPTETWTEQWTATGSRHVTPSREVSPSLTVQQTGDVTKTVVTPTLSDTLPLNSFTVVYISPSIPISPTRTTSSDVTKSDSYSITAWKVSRTESFSDDLSRSSTLRDTHISSSFLYSKSESASATHTFGSKSFDHSMTGVNLSRSGTHSYSQTISDSVTDTMSLSMTDSGLSRLLTSTETNTDVVSDSFSHSLTNAPDTASQTLSVNSSRTATLVVSLSLASLTVSFGTKSLDLSKSRTSSVSMTRSPTKPARTGTKSVSTTLSAYPSPTVTATQGIRSATMTATESNTFSPSRSPPSATVSITLNESTVTRNLTETFLPGSRTRPATRSYNTATLALSQSLTLRLSETHSPPNISLSGTRTIHEVPPPPPPFQSKVFFVAYADSTDRCTTVNMWFVFPLALLLVVELTVWYVASRCGVEVKADTYMSIPMWRSLLVRHTYFGVLVPCHIRCASIHTLRPLFHLTVMTLVYQSILHVTNPFSQSLTVIFGLVALTAAQVVKPVYNVCFDSYMFDRSLTEEEKRAQFLKDLALEEQQRQEMKASRRASFYQTQTKKMQEAFQSAVTHSSENANALRRKSSVRFREEYEVLREEELAEEKRLQKEKDEEEARKQKIQDEMYSVLEAELDIDFPPDEEVQAAIVRKAKSTQGRYVAFKLDNAAVDSAVVFVGSGGFASPKLTHTHTHTAVDPYQSYLDDIDLADDLVDIAFPGEQPQYRSAALAFAVGPSSDDDGGSNSNRNASSLSPRKIFVQPHGSSDGEGGGSYSWGNGGGTTLDGNVVDISFPGEDAQLRSIAFGRPTSSDSGGSFSVGGLAYNTTTSSDDHDAAAKGLSSPSSRFAVKDVPAVFLRPSSSFRGGEGVAAVEEQPPSTVTKPDNTNTSNSLIEAETVLSEAGDGEDSRSDAGTASGGTGTIGSSSFRRTSSSLATSVKVKKEPILTYHKTGLCCFGAVTLVLVILSSTLFQDQACKTRFYLDGWFVMVLVDIFFCDSVMIALSYVNRVLVVDESKGQKPYSELHPVDGILRYVVHERDM